MRKHRLMILLLSAATIILEALPFGAVCNFAGPDGAVRKTYAYFSLIPFGYANFGPFITAVLSVLLLIPAIISFFTSSAKVRTASSLLAAAGVVFSLLPLMFGIHYFSAVGAAISALLLAQLIITVQGKEREIHEAK